MNFYKLILSPETFIFLIVFGMILLISISCNNKRILRDKPINDLLKASGIRKFDGEWYEVLGGFCVIIWILIAVLRMVFITISWIK